MEPIIKKIVSIPIIVWRTKIPIFLLGQLRMTLVCMGSLSIAVRKVMTVSLPTIVSGVMRGLTHMAVINVSILLIAPRVKTA